MWLPDSGVFVAKCSRSFSSLVVLCMWFSQPTRTENAFHCDNGQFGVAYSDNAFEALLLIVHLLWFAQSCTANSYASANAQFTLLDATGQWAAKLLSRVVSCQAGRCELVNYFECVQTAGGDRRQFASSFIPSAMKVGQTVNISLSKAGMSVYYFSRCCYSDFSRFLQADLVCTRHNRTAFLRRVGRCELGTTDVWLVNARTTVIASSNEILVDPTTRLKH